MSKNEHIDISVLGKEYLRDICNTTKTSCRLSEAKKLIRWGTFGRNHVHPLKWVKLTNCTDEHLTNILLQPHVHNIIRKIIINIQEDRLCK